MPVGGISDSDAIRKGAFLGGWNVQSRGDISSGAQVDITVTRGSVLLVLDTDSDIYVLFDTSASTAPGVNDQIYRAGRNEIPIPLGLYDGETLSSQKVIYCHVKQVTSAASKYVRIRES